ncbi:MAG: DUF4124 domain-containing protein [Burkholderiales bacterium]
MSHRFLSLAIIAGLAFASAHAPATANTVYKWTDERGVVNYTTTPPPKARGGTTVLATPALESHVTADEEEARYWRERRQRETLRDMEAARERRETQAMRQAQARHSMALASQSAARDEEARRAAREQCLRERRIDCDNPQAASPVYYTPTPVIVRRVAPQPITSAAPFPVSGPTLGPEPGTIAGTAAQLAPFRKGGNPAQESASIRIR